MKTSTVLATLGLAAIAQAQTECAAVAAEVPTCATSCIQSALPDVGCDVTDFACQCKPENTAKINAAALECVLSSCGPVTGLAVQASASAVCDCAATAAPAAETTAAAAAVETTSAAAAVEGESDAGAEATSAVSEAEAEATSSAVEVAPYPTTTTGAGPVGAAPVASSTGAPVAGGASGNGSAGAETFTGGADGLKAFLSMVGVVGGFVAVLAVL